MDQIELLKARKAALRAAGGKIREKIFELCDEDSFVELSAFSFSGKRVYGEEPEGEGVVTGFATVGGYPFYLIAQNFESDFGGLSKGNCDKIGKTLDAAEKNMTPVVWLLRSQGVKLGEGVDVLEGVAGLLAKAARLKSEVPQYAVIAGETYGAAAAIAAMADVVFFLKEGALAVSSPLVLSAKAGKNLKKEEVGGYAALRHAGLPAVEVKDLEEVSAYLRELTELFGEPIRDAELNTTLPALNEKTDAAAVYSLIEDPIELGANSSPEVKTVLGRIGGIAVAAAVFDGVKLDPGNLAKIRRFADLAGSCGLPFVTFVDCAGVEESLAVNDSCILKEIAEYLTALDAVEAKVAVVTGSAAGLGYSLFAAKSAGFDYTYALATSKIALFESGKGAEILCPAGEDAAERLARYEAEFADPVNAAQGGYLDNVIEPRLIKQYLIASLQMLAR